MAAPTPSPPPKLDLPGTCRRRRDGTAFPPPLAGFPLPLPHLFSGLAKKLFTNRLVSAIIIPLSQVRAGGSMDRASDSGSEGWGFESLPAYHNWTPVLIQCVLKWVSSFFLQKPLFARVFLYFLTITGSTVILKGSPWSLFRFTPLYHLTKGLWGVHFEPRGVHLLIITFDIFT